METNRFEGNARIPPSYEFSRQASKSALLLWPNLVIKRVEARMMSATGARILELQYSLANV